MHAAMCAVAVIRRTTREALVLWMYVVDILENWRVIEDQYQDRWWKKGTRMQQRTDIDRAAGGVGSWKISETGAERVLWEQQVSSPR